MNGVVVRCRRQIFGGYVFEITSLCDVLNSGVSMNLRGHIAGFLFLAIIAPTFLWLGVPDAQSLLPLCCRRDGKHHCAMASMSSSGMESSGPSLHDASVKCPYRGSAKVSSATVTAPPPQFAFYAQTISHPTQFLQVLVSARISEARSHLKRGPPAIVLA